MSGDSMGTLHERRMAALPKGLGWLLTRLKAYDVIWNFSFVPAEAEEYEVGIDREETDLAKANVVSSEIKAGGLFGATRHVVALDIDHPAYLVPSSTPGHSHLYVDISGGIPHEDYMEFLSAAAKIGLIEPGYAEVSRKRGHSDLRLPWVTKDDQVLVSPERMAEIYAERTKDANADEVSASPVASLDDWEPF